jgi:hypothetical protein
MRRLFFVSAAPMLLFALACGDSGDFSLAPTDANVSGTFALVSADGKKLPIDAGETLDGTAEIYQTADEFEIGGDGQWTETTTIALQSLIDGTEQSTTSVSTGTYTISHDQIDFVRTLNGAVNFSGSVSGATLTIVYNGSRLTYARQQ